MRVFLHFRVVSFAICMLVVALLWPKFALADPHAVFFTVTGQQQLFFNVLAGLNQADYVETKELRDQTLAQREQAGFSPETAPVLENTKTELSDLLVRSLTLEGQDLYSSYLAHQFALESARREHTAELVRLFCQRGLGIQDCVEGKESLSIARDRRKRAFESNPLNIFSILANARQAIFSSGEAEDQQRRQELVDPNTTDPNTYRPYSAHISALKRQSGDEKNDAEVFLRLVGNASAGAIAPNLYEGVTTIHSEDQEDDVLIDEEADVFDILSRWVPAVSLAEQAIISGEIAAAQVQALKGASGALAPTYAKGTSVQIASSATEIGEVEEILKTPSYLTAAQGVEAVRALGELSTQPYSTGLVLDQPGTVKLIADPSQGNVAGVTTSPGTLGGQVAGTSSGSSSGLQEETILDSGVEQSKVDFSSKPVAPAQEDVFKAFLRNLNGDSVQGAGVTLDSVLNRKTFF